MMLSILSCVCWQSVYLLRRNVYLGLLPIFGLGCLSSWYWAAWTECIFWRLMLCHLLRLQIFFARSAVNLMGIPLSVICCFSLAAFNMFSLYLIFDSLINMCLGMFLLGIILYGTLCASRTWLTISFPILGNFSTIISSNIFSVPLFFSSSSGTPEFKCWCV